MKMCGKPEVNRSVLSEDDEGSMEENGSISDSGSNGGSEKVNRRRNETPEEKKLRRKLERRKRTLGRKLAKGELPVTNGASKKVIQQFNRIWEEESLFVNRVMQCLPEVRQPGLLIDDDERTEEYVSIMKTGKGVQDEERERQKAREKIRRNLKREGVELIGERAKSYQELKERLQQKLADKAQPPNAVKREKKLKKKQKRAAEAKSNKGKKLISQTASSAGASGSTEDSEVKSETTEKTPLKKKPVVKSNGEIVYSKFDFISKEARNGINGDSSSVSGKFKKGPKGNAKLTAEELLKKAEKHEKKISSLATKGKQAEAVDLAVSQKWDTALKRADGVKVRDDAYLLKKTIKKQEKLKQLTKKKWKERVERVEKMKEQRQQKRQTNIQTRKDDKKKRSKKLLRKRGRIA